MRSLSQAPPFNKRSVFFFFLSYLFTCLGLGICTMQNDRNNRKPMKPGYNGWVLGMEMSLCTRYYEFPREIKNRLCWRKCLYLSGCFRIATSRKGKQGSTDNLHVTKIRAWQCQFNYASFCPMPVSPARCFNLRPLSPSRHTPLITLLSPIFFSLFFRFLFFFFFFFYLYLYRLTILYISLWNVMATKKDGSLGYLNRIFLLRCFTRGTTTSNHPLMPSIKDDLIRLIKATLRQRSPLDQTSIGRWHHQNFCTKCLHWRAQGLHCSSRRLPNGYPPAIDAPTPNPPIPHMRNPPPLLVVSFPKQKDIPTWNGRQPWLKPRQTITRNRQRTQTVATNTVGIEKIAAVTTQIWMRVLLLMIFYWCPYLASEKMMWIVCNKRTIWSVWLLLGK